MSQGRSSSLSRVTSASVGGILVALTVTPLDVVKARLHAQGHHIVNPGAVLTDPKSVLQLRGSWHTLKFICRQEGFPGLWRGLRPTLAMTVPGTAIYFTTYDYLRDFFASHPAMTQWIGGGNRERYVSVAGSGVMARTLTVCCISPFEMVRTYQQATEEATHGLLQTFRTVVARSGWRQLWSGLVPTLWRDVPFSSLYWFSLEYLRDRMELWSVAHLNQGVTTVPALKMDASSSAEDDAPVASSSAEDDAAVASSSALATAHPPEEPSGLSGTLCASLAHLFAAAFVRDFVGGAVAGVVASIATNPFDVMKTRRQMFLTHHEMPRRSMREIATLIYQRQGLQGFMSGLIPRSVKIAPACAIMISSYELCKRLLSE